MKRFLALALLVGLGLSTAFHRAEAATPAAAEAFVQDMIDEAIDALTIPTSEEAKRRAAFEKLLNERLDFATIRQRVLGIEWKRATPDQKEQFTKVFDDYILNVYVGQLGPYDDQQVQVIRTEQLDEDEIVVFTEVLQDDGSRLRLDWRIREDDSGDYGVVDVAADGASLLRAKRDEFKSIVQRQGIGGLIDQIAAVNQKSAG